MSTSRVLHGDSLASAAQPWLDELGKSDRDRLQIALDLAVAEKTQMSQVLTKLFPEVEEKKAMADLTKLRKRLNDAAEAHDLNLGFHADTKKQNPPGERWCWFTGLDPAEEQAKRFSEEVTADIEGKTFVKSLGIATTGSAMAAGKRVVRFFISYAHNNKTQALAVVDGLRAQFKASARYELEVWIDHDIMLGHDWHQRILQAIKDCDFGLFMVSPDFLGSDYIGKNEIPPFLGEATQKPVLPVGLVPVSFGRHDLKGLQEKQVFLRRGRTFDEMRSAADKRRFVHDLYLEIEKSLDAHFGPETSKPKPPGLPCALPDSFIGPLSAEDAECLMRVPEDTKHFQRTKGHAFNLSERESLNASKPNAGEARDALNELEAWASRPDGSPFFALLGEVGIGKTTTLKQFTRQLIEKRKKEPKKHPLPIYIDLRDYVGDTPGAVPTLEQLLTSVIQRAWRVTDRKVSAGDLMRLVREEGALMIFDGLDEKIVHLTPDRARDFIRTLWSVLPDAMLAKKLHQDGKRRGKVIISCRSHYFRDVWSQNAMLCGEDRESLDRSQYPAFCLLPFGEDQIRSYLTSFLGDDTRGKEAFELIASIHNLRDLAERPYLLTLISGRLGELEALQAHGEVVNAARLYDLVVRSWLNRDDGKHQIEAAHKRRLMEDLAAALWRSGEKQWDVDRLEEWLDDFLLGQPAMAQAYANKDRALLKEDLRTATFVLRPDSEEKSFRFAHTSLQEYFLAAYLVRALRDGVITSWDMPLVSMETLDFIGQILAVENRPGSLKTLESILGGECLQAACLAFRYWLQAIDKGHPEPQPAHVNLAGAEMDEWTIRGHGANWLLPLRGANLKGAKLNRVRLEFVDLSGADLSGMQARQGLFLKANAAGAKVDGADFGGLLWRGGSLQGVDLEAAAMSGAELIGLGVAIPPKGAACAPHSLCLSPRQKEIARAFTGHSGSVLACAWSPDGQRLLSGSWDNTLKVWDAVSGQERFSLKGHSGSVWACTWSPDGQSLLSGSDDKTLKVWDAVSGQERFSLKGHLGYVRACAWSPDGQSLLSGSDDNTLKVWDAASGQERFSLKGHWGSVSACAWSPDGRHLLSGSDDNILKVWDAVSGQERFSLKGHWGPVRACAWSPDGQSLLSGSDDKTLKVWDAVSGQERFSLRGHSGSVRACAWSPDGQSLLSGSWDKTLKVWDAVSGQERFSLKGHSGSVRTCVWSLDGQSLLSGSDDKTLKVWDATSGDLLWTGHLLPDGQSAAISADERRILGASLEAWRWLGWRVDDEEGRFLHRLPAEAFGPLPGAGD